MEQAISLQTTLRSCAIQFHSLNDPWWIIGSASVALHGENPGPVSDIDVLVSVADAKMLGDLLACTNLADTRSDRFRSKYFLKPKIGPVPVEIMAGLEVRNNGQWHPLVPKSRQSVPIGDQQLYIPDRQELITILRLFGRVKDIKRAELLTP